MGLPQVKKCCCVSLETGVYYIYKLEIATAFSYIVSYIASLKSELDASSDGQNTLPNSEASPFLSRNVILLIGHIVCGIIQLLCGLSLFIAMRDEFPSFMAIAVILGIIDVCLFIPMIIVQSGFWLIDGFVAIGISLLVFLPFIVALKFYKVVVVSSLRKEILSSFRRESASNVIYTSNRSRAIGDQIYSHQVYSHQEVALI